MCPSLSTVSLWTNIFSNFKSLWAMPKQVWRWWVAETNYLNIHRASYSFIPLGRFSVTHENRLLLLKDMKKRSHRLCIRVMLYILIILLCGWCISNWAAFISLCMKRFKYALWECSNSSPTSLQESGITLHAKRYLGASLDSASHT